LDADERGFTLIKEEKIRVFSVNPRPEIISDNVYYLELAISKGFDDFEWARQDPDFENIRNDPRFKELVGK